MVVTSKVGGSGKNAWMSEVDPEFAALIPQIDKAFEKIWTYNDMDEFRGNWTTTRTRYADYIPSQGFETKHMMITVSDGSQVEIRLYRPQNSSTRSLPLLFVLHGGGWVVGNHDSENAMSRAVCVKNQMAVLSVDYRRAPEHQFPTALNDGYDAYQWTIQNASSLHIDPMKIILGGTSAGANLIAGLVLKLRHEQALQGVIGQILNVPALCHPDHLPRDKYDFLESYEQNADAPTINGTRMRWFWNQYYPNAEPNELANPLLASNLDGLPPTLIQVAGMDPLRDEGIAFATALENDRVPTKLNIYPGLPHGFVLAIHMAVVTKYYQAIVNWVSTRLTSSESSKLQYVLGRRVDLFRELESL